MFHNFAMEQGQFCRSWSKLFTIFVHPSLFLHVTIDSVCLVYAQEKREESI